MIYLDMDGVIADFFSAIEDEFGVDHWKDLDFKEQAFSKLKNTDFFNRIPEFPVSDKVVTLVKEYAFSYDIDWGICSSPLRGDAYNSSYWKRVWLQRKAYMPKVSNCIFTANKHKYAWSELDRMPNILIDDKPQNIKRWVDAGGIGIRYQANEDDFEEYLVPELSKALIKRRQC